MELGLELDKFIAQSPSMFAVHFMRVVGKTVAKNDVVAPCVSFLLPAWAGRTAKNTIGPVKIGL
jgi:hypothetical protein